MRISRKVKYALIFSGCIVLIILGLLNFYISHLRALADVYYSRRTPSFSREESIRHGVFRKDVPIDVDTIKVSGEKFRITHAWIEEQSELEIHSVVFTRRILLGKYRLCFEVDKRVPGRLHATVSNDMLDLTEFRVPNNRIIFAAERFDNKLPNIEIRLDKFENGKNIDVSDGRWRLRATEVKAGKG